MDDTITGNPNRDLSKWLMNQRLEIEKVMHARLGAAAPAASGPEAETLRRFRTFASTALMRGEAPRPVLDGLRPNERRVMALLTCWTESATELAGPEREIVATALAPLLDAFRLAIRTTGTKRNSSGRPRATPPSISAAIARVADHCRARGAAAARTAAGRARYVQHDVTQEADWQGAVAAAVKEFGRIDILVNNAGITIPRVAIEDRTVEEWDLVQAVNLKGVFLGTKH